MQLGLITPPVVTDPPPRREEMARPPPLGPRAGGAPVAHSPTPPRARCPATDRAASSAAATVATSLLPATMVTTFCSPEYHGNRIPLPAVLWQPLSTTHNTRGRHILLAAVLRQPHSITHSTVADRFC